MESNNFDIQEELKKLPGRPGVYIMHDEKDRIIYVGKAISLKNRVRQYFQSSRNKGVKIEQMVTHIRRFEYIVTDSELEALVLECNLIKEYRPKYNTMLMDDKTAQGVFDNYIRMLGEGLVNIINALRPEAIILGGGVCAQGDVLLVPLKKYIAKYAFGEGPHVGLHIASLKNDAGIIGAAALVAWSNT